MATWKKIIVSGSDAALNALTLDTPLQIGTGVNQFFVGVNTRTIQFAGGPQPGVVNLRFPDEPDNTYTIDLPAATGTVALLSDVSANANLAVSGSTQNSTINLATQALSIVGARPAVTSAVTGNATVAINVRDASATEDGLITTGSQTIAGAKTFNNFPRIKAGNGAGLATIDYLGSNDNRTLTIPNPGANATFVVTEGAQTINGAKTFSSTITGSISGTSSNVTGTVAVGNGGTGQTSYTNGQLLIGNSTGNTLSKATLTAGTGISVTNGAGSITIAATNNGTVTSVAALTLGTTGTDLNSTVADSTTTPVITLNVPDASATARGVITTGAQTIAGAKTFQNDVVIGTGGGTGSRSLRIQAVTAGNAIVDLVPATGGSGILNVSGSFPLVLQTNSIPRLTIAADGNATFAQNVIVSGDLTVDGSTTTLNTTNLLVEDRYILLNSGSAGGVNKGGIIIDGGSGIGKAFILGQNSGRWGFTGSLAQDATTATPDAFVAAVVTSDIVEYQKVGNIRVDTGTGDIFIYS